MALGRENYKYQLVSIDNMNSQINVRLPQKLLKTATAYAEKHGYSTVQDFIRETVRQRLFPENLELSAYAKRALAKARKQPESTYVDLDDLRDNL